MDHHDGDDDGSSSEKMVMVRWMMVRVGKGGDGKMDDGKKRQRW